MHSRPRVFFASLRQPPAVSPLAALVPQFWPFTVDDTFITLRLRAWVRPHVEPRRRPVEGYTSLLWTLLMSPPHWALADAEWVAKGLGEGAVAFAAASVALLTVLPRGRSGAFLGWGALLYAAPEGQARRRSIDFHDFDHVRAAPVTGVPGPVAAMMPSGPEPAGARRRPVGLVHHHHFAPRAAA